MFQFVSPIWLFALTGIVIPVIIHLWNRKQTRPLKIGSILLLHNSNKSSSKKLQINELLLLLLRCCIVILTTLLLADPFYLKKENSYGISNWIIIERSNFKPLYYQYKTQIDSLLKQNAELHYFETGFSKTDLQTAINAPSPIIHNDVPYWLLLTSLQQQLPANTKVFLYTSARLVHFKGNRPSLSVNIEWNTLKPKDTIAQKDVAAFLNKNDSVVIQTINTTSFINYYTQKSFAKSNSTSFQPDTSTIRVDIYAEGNNPGIHYLHSALKAIEQFTGRKINIHMIKDLRRNSSADWLFWLSSAHIPPSAKYKQVVTCEEPSQASQLPKGNVIWKDALSKPLLLQTSFTQYKLYSKLVPSEINDIVWDGSLPQMLASLLFGERNNNNLLYDERSIAAAQLKPVAASNSNHIKNAVYSKTSLDKPLWIALFIILLAERLLSLNTKNKKTGV